MGRELVPEQDPNESKPQEQEAPAAIAYPDGLSDSWVKEKAKHLNKAHAEWFTPQYLLSIEENYKLYEGKKVGGQLPGGVNIPIVTSIVDTNQARLSGAVLGLEKYVEAIPLDPQQILAGQTDENETVEDFINEALVMTPDFVDKGDELIKMALLENVGVAQAKWSIERVWNGAVQRDIVNGIPVAIGISETEEERGYPDFEPVSLMDLAWDPRCKDKLANSAWIRRRRMVSANDLLKMEQDGIIQNATYAIDNAPKKDGQSAADTGQIGEADPDAKRSQDIEGVNLPAVGFDDSVYQLDEWWATLSWKDSQGKWNQGEFQFWIVGGEVIVKFRENPLKPQRKPFLTWKVSRKPGMLLSTGPVETVKELTKDLLNLMSRRNRIVTRAANTPTFYEPSSGLDARKGILQEASLIPVLSVNGIKMAEVPVQVLDALDKAIAFDISQAREATANSEQAQGIASEGDTATEAQILAAGANVRFQYSADSMLSSFFAPLAQEYFWLFKQFGQEGMMVVRDAGLDGQAKEVTLNDLQGNYRFKAIPAQGTSQKLKRFELLKGTLTELVTAQAQNPMLFTDQQGTPMKIEAFEFLKTQLLPLLDIKANSGLFSPAQPMPMGMPQSMAPNTQMPSEMPMEDSAPLPEGAML